MTPSWTPPDAEVVTLAEAAVRLGISPDAARKRLERGTLQGEKRSGRWRVFLGPDAEVDAARDAIMDFGRTPPDAAFDRSDAARTPLDAAPDIAPLTELLADVTRRNEELSAAAALWQYRAMQAEERLAQLEAGPVAGGVDQSAAVAHERAPVSDVAPAGAPGTLIDRLRRLLGRT